MDVLSVQPHRQKMFYKFSSLPDLCADSSFGKKRVADSWPW